MKINCYIALVAAALGCACNPLADTDDMDNNVQATRIAFSPEVVTLDNAGRNAEEDQGQSVIVTLNPKARKSMAWSAETDKTETWCTLTECSVTDADGVTHRGFRITATENTAYKRTATVTLTAADGTQEMLRVVQTGVYPDAEVTVDPKQIEFNADEIVPVDVSFTTNMGDVYAVSRDEDADWISWEDLGGNVIRFTAAPWDDEEQPRTANVYITVGSEETSAATAKIPVTQLAKDLYCYVWGASLFDYDRFELARRMTKSEAGVYRFDAYFTAGNAPEIRINTVLRAVTFGLVQGPEWLSDPSYALWIICFLRIWQFGSAMVLFLAALKGVPADLYEAATIDGAGKWRQFFSITVPMITPIIFYNLVTQICQAFQEFNGPYIITNGGPRGSTTLISLLVYNYAFKSYDMGMASALAWIMFIIVCILTIIAFTSQKKWVYYSDER